MVARYRLKRKHLTVIVPFTAIAWVHYVIFCYSILYVHNELIIYRPSRYNVTEDEQGRIKRGPMLHPSTRSLATDPPPVGNKIIYFPKFACLHISLILLFSCSGAAKYFFTRNLFGIKLENFAVFHFDLWYH